MELLRAGYSTLSRGDIAAWGDLLDDDVVLQEVAEVPDADVYRGRAAAMGWAERGYALLERWEWTIEEVLERTEDVMVLRVRLSAIGRESGAPMDATVFHFLRLRGLRVVEVRGYFDREAALAKAAELR